MRLGILVKQLDISQAGYSIIQSLNSLDKSGHDIIVFYEDWNITFGQPRFAMLQAKEVWQYDGIVIATDIRTAKRLLRTPGPTSKYFYVWDLEWLNGQFQFEQLAELYMNPALKLIARSDFHASILEQCWSKPVLTMSDFDPNILVKLLNNEGDIT